MRTTLTLDEDVAQEVKRLMSERGAGFKETINELLRRGLRSGESKQPYVSPVYELGALRELDKALSVAASLDDEETIRQLGVRS